MSAIVRGSPRPEPGPLNQVIQLDAGEHFEGVILSPAIWGVGTHWDDSAGRKGRSQRCTREHGDCQACKIELPYRWKGYLYCFCFTRRKGVFVELTPFVAKQIELLATKDLPLRGQRLRLQRGAAGPKTRIRVEVLEFRGDTNELGHDQDPEPILEMLWKWKR